jgi:alpha-N-acetylglucosamine transferase
MYFLKDHYYRGALEKFNTFLLTDYDRVIVMDSDGLVFHNIDHLFGISFPEGVQIAAPQGYWFEKEGHLPAELECRGNLTFLNHPVQSC